MRGKSSVLLLGLVFCFIYISLLAHSEDKQDELQKMLLGDEAFQAILQFYQYDKDIPLDAPVVEKKVIDYLETRKDIDPNRIGVIGYSLGGTMSLILTGVDSRIKVTSACVAPLLMHPISPDQPDLSAIAPYNFIRVINRLPVLMLMGRNDYEINYTVDEAQAFYDLIKGESKEIVFYDCEHRLPEEHVSKALQWFKNHIQ